MLYRPLIAFTLFVLFNLSHAADKLTEHPVEPTKLSQLIQQADKIVVTDGPRKDAKVLFSSSDPQDIAEFDHALTVELPKEWFHCMCDGTPAVRLFRGDAELVLVTNHHGRSVRCSLWTSDAMLKDTQKWLQWFDARKLPGPRREFTDMTARAKQSEIHYALWTSAMPTSLRPVWEKVGNGFRPDLDPIRAALAKEFPDIQQRALALFSWFGSGAGPWSGFPSYESIAGELLLDISTPDLVAAAHIAKLTDAQIEGAARLFGSWDFSQKRRNDLKTLPSDLKKKLLAHSLKSTDRDKIGRAKNAFE